MIFKQVDEILSGQKTQTRRVVKPGEFVYQHGNQNPDGIWAIDTVFTLIDNPEKYEYKDRIKWAVGRTYAVVPRRGKPAVWWAIVDGIPIWNHPVRYEPFYQPGEPTDWENGHYVDLRHELEYQGFQPLRIRITAIRQERLQDISEADAKAEGVADAEAYRALWQAINGKTPGARWADSPLVWVLEFEVVNGEQS